MENVDFVPLGKLQKLKNSKTNGVIWTPSYTRAAFKERTSIEIILGPYETASVRVFQIILLYY